MKLDDIIALAKQGYKPADIKELIEISKEEPKEEEDQKEELEETKDSKEELQEPKEELQEPKDIDYKKLYEESQQALKDAQKKNIKKDASSSEEKTDSEILEDFARSFM